MPEINFTSTDTNVATSGVPDAPLQTLNPAARTLFLGQSTSRSQRRIQEDVESLRRELDASGMLRPATIINFNPIPLVQDGLVRMTVPEAGYSESGKVEFTHNGHRFIGHAFTVRSPLIYQSTEGHETDTDTMSDMPVMKPNYILPIGIAYSFLEHYSLAAKDSAHMGGVLIFEGDRHTLSPDHLERSGGMIRVPEPVRLPRNRRTFTTKLRSLDEVAEEVFAMQAIYADFRIQNAHSLWTTNDPMQQRQVTNLDRTWARFAQEHGAIEVLPDWVGAKAITGAAMASVVRCPMCSKPQPLPNIFLCPECRAPYNAFEAYMNGCPVPQMYLDSLPDEQLQTVMAEQVRRENRSKKFLAEAKRNAKKADAESGQTEVEE